MMEITELKRKLRQLKKLEMRIRLTGRMSNEESIWNQFFSTRNEHDGSVKYNMTKLSAMDRQNLKDVFDEFFYAVYYQHYKENGIFGGGMDIDLLSKLGLPPGSSAEAVKTKFRELAKKHHPDLGGDSAKFIELFKTYKKLIRE